VISIQYTGTPALKTDFTRTGKRTHKGALNDGKHSIRRYFINNFQDYHNLDCLSISLGHLKPSANLKERGFFTHFKLILSTFFLSLFVLSYFLEEYLPHEGEMKPWLLHMLVYGVTFTLGVVTLYKNS
jgi:hypothetical protein